MCLTALSVENKKKHCDCDPHGAHCVVSAEPSAFLVHVYSAGRLPLYFLLCDRVAMTIENWEILKVGLAAYNSD